jgi:hypothetical protein
MSIRASLSANSRECGFTGTIDRSREFFPDVLIGAAGSAFPELADT